MSAHRDKDSTCTGNNLKMNYIPTKSILSVFNEIHKKLCPYVKPL